jgi:trimethylamine:corrinoid methyltransferase-like protein
MTEEVHHRRGGGRAARQVTRNTSNAQREAFLTRSIKPYELVSDENGNWNLK